MSEVVTTGSTGAAPSSGASTASTESTPVSTPASATATPSEATSAAASTPAPSGEPPRDRWDDILNNTRTKTRSEVEAEYRQKYGWADQFQTDPYTFVDSWVDQLAAHPQYQAQILAKAARLLNARRGQQPSQVVEEPQPDVPIVDAQGNVTGQTYSAKQLKAWREWDWAQKSSALDQRIQPLEQMRTAIEQQAQAAQLHAQSAEHAKTTLGELRQDPYFKEHEPKVKAAFMAHPEWGDNIHRAYHHVLQTEVFPSISQTAESKVLAHLKTQAAGGTVNPGQTAPSQAPKFKDFGEALRYFESHPAEAEAMAKR